MAVKTHCIYGHPFDYSYTKKSGEIAQICLVCRAAYRKKYRDKRRILEGRGIRERGDFVKINGVFQTHMPVYWIWMAIKARCSNKKHKEYKNYGGRGISICARWALFEHFYADMGDKPEGMSIDRKDNDGNYEPGNCRWATPVEQTVNRSTTKYITWEGKTMCVAHWEKYLGFKKSLIRLRLKAGWPLEKVFTAPLNYRGPK